MTKKHIIANCSEQIKAACQAIGAHLETVKIQFRYREKTVVVYSYKDRNECALEIKFENATLNCLFDYNNICIGTFLFLDDPNDISHYIEYCKQACRYDYFLHVWITNSCYIEIHSINERCNLLIFPIRSDNL